MSYQLPAVLNSLLKQSVEPFAARSPGQRTEATPTFVRMRHCALLQRPHLAMEVSKTAADNERPPCGTRQARRARHLKSHVRRRLWLRAAEDRRASERTPFQFQPAIMHMPVRHQCSALRSAIALPLDVRAYSAAGWTTCGSSASSP